jgi:hypothetical protein
MDFIKTEDTFSLIEFVYANLCINTRAMIRIIALLFFVT